MTAGTKLGSHTVVDREVRDCRGLGGKTMDILSILDDVTTKGWKDGKTLRPRRATR
jgi:hypothetical protein